MAETEELTEHDQGEAGGNTDNTEHGVGMLPWWFFLSGVRTRQVQHYSVNNKDKTEQGVGMLP